MAEGKIGYDDLFAADLNSRVKELTQSIKELNGVKTLLKKELNGMATSHKKTSDVMRESVEVTEDLTNLQKEELKLKQKLADATTTQATTNEALKVEIADLNRERKNAVKLGKAQEGSMAQLHQQLALNRKAYRDMSKEQRNNTKVGGKLLKTIKQQDKEIKKLDATIGNHQRNVGNYGNALRDVGSEFGLMGGAARQATVALGFVANGFKTLRLALMSTGIGAIVVAIGSLVAYFQSTHEAAVKLEKLLAPLKVTFNVLKDMAADLGESLYNTFSQPKQFIKDLWEAIKNNIVVRINSVIELFGLLGTAISQVFSSEWEAAAETAKQAGSVMVDALTGVEDTLDKGGKAWVAYKEFMQEYYNEVEKKTGESIALIEREAALERARLKNTTERATLESRIAENRLKAQELQNKDALAGLKYQEQAIALTKQMYEQDRLLLAEEIAIEAERQAMFDSNLEDEQKLAEMRANLIRLDKQQADGLRELQERYLSLQRAIKATADAEADVSADIDEVIADIDEELSAELDAAEQRDELAQKQMDMEDARKQATEETAVAAIGALGDVLEAMGANAEAVKAVSSAEALVATYLSATKAYAALVGIGPAGPILAAIAAAASIAAGLANVAKINSVSIPKYAEGTEYVPLQGNQRGTDTIPAMLNEGERVVPSHINRLLLGVPNEALPSLMSGAGTDQARLEQIARQQLMQIAMTNKLLRGGLRYTDHDGSIVDPEGNKKTYVN